MASSSLFPDPLQMWRDAVTRLENDINAALTGGTKSQEVVHALHQFSGMTLTVEQLLEKAIGGYLRRANLPSRKEVVELAESLRRIEDKLDRLLPANTAMVPRPARTRRPPAAAVATVPVAAPPPEPAPAKAPAARTRRTTRGRKG